ncbi:MAG: helix-turn-helix domain-containing protein [Oscillatoriales cyanobacterium]|nr:MAG: helix-turn-helix domain-containing protein [Oscillatoriales cyanobacterium]
MNDSTMPADSPQVECLVDIGNQLRECRESQGLTIEAVAATTKIQRRILQALEAADSAALPEPIYVRGFITKYAAALGLDGEGMARAYPLQNGVAPARSSQRVLSLLPAPQLKPAHLVFVYVGLLIASVLGLSALLRQNQPASVPIVVPSPRSSPIASPSPTASSSPTAIASPDSSVNPARPNATPSASPTVAASPSPTPSRSPSPSPTPSPTLTPSPTPIPSPSPTPSRSPSPTPTPSPTPSRSPQPSPVASPSPRASAPASPAPRRSPSPASPSPSASTGESALIVQGIASSIRLPRTIALPPSAPVRVALRLSERSWVRITSDGKTVFEGVLPQGTQRLVTAQRNLVVVTGNAGGTFLSYNEGTERKLGNNGAVQAARFEAVGAARQPANANPRNRSQPGRR